MKRRIFLFSDVEVKQMEKTKGILADTTIRVSDFLINASDEIEIERCVSCGRKLAPFEIKRGTCDACELDNFVKS